MKKMKKVLQILSLLMIVLTFQSCKKEKLKEDEMKDKAGNIYKKVKIGDQEWMASNLCALFTDEKNGTAYSATSADYRYPDGNSQMDINTYGLLYSYTSAKVLLPGDGWRIPTLSDMQRLAEALGFEDYDDDGFGAAVKGALRINKYPGYNSSYVSFDKSVLLLLDEQSSNLQYDYQAVQLFARDFSSEGIYADDFYVYDITKNTYVSVRFVRDVN